MIDEIRYRITDHYNNKIFRVGKLVDPFIKTGKAYDIISYNRMISVFTLVDLEDHYKLVFKYYGYKKIVKILKRRNGYHIVVYNYILGSLNKVYVVIDDDGSLILSDKILDGFKNYECDVRNISGLPTIVLDFGLGVEAGEYYEFKEDGKVILVPSFGKKIVIMSCSLSGKSFNITNIVNDVLFTVDGIDCVKFFYDMDNNNWLGLKKCDTVNK
jgi:hypothetical protein